MITYIMGYWRIPGNPKRDLNYYKNITTNTLKLLKNKHIVFFYREDEIKDRLSYLNNEGHKIMFMKSPIEELPTYGLSDSLLNSCKNQNITSVKDKEKEKGYVHHMRDLKQSDHETYKKIITVWTSKLFLVEQIINTNPYNTDHFAWVDVSATRFNVRHLYYTSFVKGLFNAINTTMQYKGERMFHGATIMIADKETWSWIIPLYKEKLEEQKDSNYGHDEETLMFLIYKDHPERFIKILTIEQENSGCKRI
jgi:hypothetical protein